MACAGDEQHITGAEISNGGCDGLGALGYFGGARTALQDFGPDYSSVFRARVIVGDVSHVGDTRGDFAHQAALAAITVAATAEYHCQLAGGVGAERVQHSLERIGGVGVVDIYRRAVGGDASALQSARHAFEMFEGRNSGDRIGAAGQSEAQGAQGVADLEDTGERQADAEVLFHYDEVENLAVAVDGCTQQLQRGAGLAVAQYAMTAQAAGDFEGGEFGAVGIQNGDTAFLHDVREQAQLGREVGGHGAVIVQMVARHVGEASDGDFYAIDAELVQAVAGGFHGEMCDALVCHLGQQAVQLGGIRCCQAAVDFYAGTKGAERAEVAGLQAE